MRSYTFLTTIVALKWAAAPVSAQTYSNCNPLTNGNCPPNTALGKSVNIDFTSGPSDSFTPEGSPTYDSNGVSFTVAKAGDSPLVASKWYIMFGHVEFVLKAAPGVGIVSSAILQSDDLDEIDFEWLGYDNANVQTNYFGKGETTTYDRGEITPAAGNHDGFSTYTIDWTADQITWSVNGNPVRTLSASSTGGYPYPQTPMMIKVGAWSGGDASNAEGTRGWATGQGTGAYTDYSSGPYTMTLKSIAVTDYSTGSQYKYSGTDGTWQSITAVGGTVNPNGQGNAVQHADTPSVTGTTDSPMPFQGTHRDSSSSIVQPNAGGWTPTTLATSSTATVTTYPGLPAGWTVTSSGKVLPPSAASATSPQSSPTSPQWGLQEGSPAAGGYEVFTSYNDQGLNPAVVTRAAGVIKHYNDQGFLITSETALAARSSPTAVAESPVSSVGRIVAAAEASASPKISKVSDSASGAALRLGQFDALLGAMSCIVGGFFIV